MSVLIDKLNAALADRSLVQSFSGVRTVFGHGPEISDEMEALSIAYSYCYARNIVSGENVSFLLGRDPRPTGGSVVRALARGFLAGCAASKKKAELINLGIITTPLAEMAIRALNSDGGVMVTASHNPIDNNGFKFLTGCSFKSPSSAPAGALLSAKTMGTVIGLVKNVAVGNDCDFEECVQSITPEKLEIAFENQNNDAYRVQAERSYLDVIGRDWGITPHCLKPLTLGPVLLDPNGGAGCGIDARVLEHFGVRVIEINAESGYPEHAIDTDGIDPASGRHMLLRVARATDRNRAHFGVAFDYDADRGNLVLPGHDESDILPPQRVATFNIALALSRRKLRNNPNGKLAVVISDATSLASHKVAMAFGADIFQVETGEINVVSKMHVLRNEGYDVPVGVEGANGGTIFESATCRDGLQVALSAAQAESMPEVACEWMKVINGINGYSAGKNHCISLPELIASVPMNYNKMLKLSSDPIAHGEIKRNMESYFDKIGWAKLSDRFDDYKYENFEETNMVEKRTGDESGAWRVMMMKSGTPSAFIFVRGSKTESGIWRIIIDAESSEDYEITEQVAMQMFETAIAK